MWDDRSDFAQSRLCVSSARAKRFRQMLPATEAGGTWLIRPPPPYDPIVAYAYGHMAVLGGSPVSYERGTPVVPSQIQEEALRAFFDDSAPRRL